LSDKNKEGEMVGGLNDTQGDGRDLRMGRKGREKLERKWREDLEIGHGGIGEERE